MTRSRRRKSTGLLSHEDRALVERFWPFFRPYRRQFIIGSACGVGDALLQTALLYTIKWAIHYAASGSFRALALVLALQLGIVLCKSVFIFSKEFLVFSSGLRTAMDFRNAVYEHVQTLSLGYFHRTQTGHLMSRLTSDVRIIEDGLTSNLTNAVTGPSSIVFQVVALFILNWRLTLLSFFLVPLVVTAVQMGSRLMRKAAEQRQESQAELTTVLEETISGVRVVQSFGGEKKEVDRFRRKGLDAYRAAMRGVRVTAVQTPSLEIVTILAVILIISVGAIEMHSHRIEVEGLFTFVILLNSVAAAFKQLGRTVTNFQQTFNAAERLFAILDEEPEIRDRPNAVSVARPEGEIAFESVVFGYEDEQPILQGVSFRARPGEMLAFVGSSGAGKTTLVNLVPRFYDPQGGRILVDGVDIRDLKLADLRRQIGIVPQETQLFSGTVEENIAYAKADATGDEIQAAARAANAHDFIAALADGYRTVVGEKGAKLSGGQRQRIAIARAVLKDPALLILDEATSSLDPESEQSVAEALDRLMRGRTTFVIAHRLSTIRRAHRIFVIEAGRIAEEGTEDELLDKRGIYHRLFNAQFADGAGSTVFPPSEEPGAAALPG